MTSKLRRWLREGLFLLVMLAVITLVMDHFRAPQAPRDFASDTVVTLDGKSITLADLSAEKPLLVYFWASWCGVCRFTTPKVADYAAEGGNVLSVALRSGDDAKVQRYLSQKQFAIPTVNDTSGARSAQWEIGVTPTFVIVHQGKVVSTTTGWTSLTGLKLRLWWAGRSA
ncbi:protein disulfide oxidoreductase [Enterobacterales bacterium CwR94]|nr:protein disulfide oxidoreductase [Enterobacterales bacterium CwR94]